MSRLTLHTVESAPEAARERVAAAEQANGFLPNLIGVLANAPAALETYQVVGAINGRTSLSPAEREVVQITAATLNDCGFCVAGHTKLSLHKLRMPAELVEALRKVEAIADPKLNALARFSVAIIEKKGQVSDDELAAFRAAGYTDQQALEVVLGVSLATLCNFANSLAQTPINPELQPFANPELTAFA
ncbi:MAG: carboxymuconolactone decarboxylase family protein [Alcaligenaceae bacterium]|nr:carboxymuconolactone decarboxylase family protein [Alcaligenaceae bacterium]